MHPERPHRATTAESDEPTQIGERPHAEAQGERRTDRLGKIQRDEQVTKGVRVYSVPRRIYQNLTRGVCLVGANSEIADSLRYYFLVRRNIILVDFPWFSKVLTSFQPFFPSAFSFLALPLGPLRSRPFFAPVSKTLYSYCSPSQLLPSSPMCCHIRPCRNESLGKQGSRQLLATVATRMVVHCFDMSRREKHERIVRSIRVSYLPEAYRSP